jgi:hypothetical protein
MATDPQREPGCAAALRVESEVRPQVRAGVSFVRAGYLLKIWHTVDRISGDAADRMIRAQRDQFTNCTQISNAGNDYQVSEISLPGSGDDLTGRCAAQRGGGYSVTIVMARFGAATSTLVIQTADLDGVNGADIAQPLVSTIRERLVSVGA